MFRYISFILLLLLLGSSNNILFAQEFKKGIKYIGEMNVQRALHNSRKLSDGTVLIFGGYNRMVKYSDYLKGPSYHQQYSSEESSEIYNPTDNTFKKTDINNLPIKKEISALPSEQEQNIIKKYFEEKNISFKNIRYEKIDEENILCIPYYYAHPLSYGFHPVSEYFTIYNLKTKKINPLVSFNNVKAKYLNFKSFNTDAGIRIFFIYDYYINTNYNSSIYFQTAIFNPNKNIFEKISKPIKINLFYKHRLFQLENENIIIEEDNIVKYIFDVQKNKLKPLKNYGFRMNEASNVISLNNHQLLITGGYTIKESKEPTLKDKKIINGNSYYLLPERIISKSAYIYSF